MTVAPEAPGTTVTPEQDVPVEGAPEETPKVPETETSDE